MVTEETIFKLVRRTANGTQNVNGENVSVVIGTCQTPSAIEFNQALSVIGTLEAYKNPAMVAQGPTISQKTVAGTDSQIPGIPWP